MSGTSWVPSFSDSPLRTGYGGKKNFEGDSRGKRKEGRMISEAVRPGAGTERWVEAGKGVYQHCQQTRIEAIKRGIVLRAEEVKRNFYL